jgi:hypothetical protein
MTKIKTPLSNAFHQKRSIGISSHSKLSIPEQIEKAHKRGLKYKRISQAAQAVENIQKRHEKAREFWDEVAKDARKEGHLHHPNEYSLKYPEAQKRLYARG